MKRSPVGFIISIQVNDEREQVREEGMIRYLLFFFKHYFWRLFANIKIKNLLDICKYMKYVHTSQWRIQSELLSLLSNPKEIETSEVKHNS